MARYSSLVGRSRFSRSLQHTKLGSELVGVHALVDWLVQNIRPVAKGSYGTVYVIDRQLPRLQKHLRRIRQQVGRRHQDVWVDRIPRRPVVIKVQTSVYPRSPVDVQRSIWHNEVQVQRRLSRFSFVPIVYAALLTSKMHVTIMDYAQGSTPLRKILPKYRHHSKHHFLQKVYRNINTALIQMWKSGVLHLDMHTDNVLVDRYGRVTFIDFGLALMSGTVQHIARRFSTRHDAIRLWPRLQAIAYRYVQLRRLPYYYPNVRVLQSIRKRLS